MMKYLFVFFVVLLYVQSLLDLKFLLSFGPVEDLEVNISRAEIN